MTSPLCAGSGNPAVAGESLCAECEEWAKCRSSPEAIMINTGEKVTYVVANIYSRSVKISARDGVMVKYGDRVCEVKARNGRIIPVRTHLVRLQGGHNALTEAVLSHLEDIK